MQRNGIHPYLRTQNLPEARQVPPDRHAHYAVTQFCVSDLGAKQAHLRGENTRRFAMWKKRLALKLKSPATVTDKHHNPLGAPMCTRRLLVALIRRLAPLNNPSNAVSSTDLAFHLLKTFTFIDITWVSVLS